MGSWVQHLEASAGIPIVRDRTDDEFLDVLLTVHLDGLLVRLELCGIVVGVPIRILQIVVVVRVFAHPQLQDDLKVGRHKASRDGVSGECDGLLQYGGGVLLEVLVLL